MRRLLLFALALCACERAPDDPVFFFGEARGAGSAPLSGAEITLLRTDEPSCVYGFPSEPGASVEELGQTVVDAEGAFLLRLFGYQVAAGTIGYACFQANLESGPTGASSSVEWTGFRSDVSVRNFFRWDAAEIGLAEGDSLTLVPPAFPFARTTVTEWSGPIRPELFAYGWELSVDGQTLWREEATEAPARISDFVLEDFGGPIEARIDLLAELNPEQLTPFIGIRYDLTARSPSRVVAAAKTVPVSRGATCGFEDRTIDPCPLTDGSLRSVLVAGPVPEYGDDGLEPFAFTLPRPAAPRTLIVRDLVFEFGSSVMEVEGSADGETWWPLAPLPLFDDSPADYNWLNGDERFETIPLQATPEPVRFVRFTKAPSFFRAREISFFE